MRIMCETKATKEEMRVEALRRMVKLGVDQSIIDAFNTEVLAQCEKFYGFFPKQFVVLASRIESEIAKIVRETEREYNIMAYMVIKTNTDLGLLYDVLYVSSHKEEWEMDEEMMEENIIMSYCINTSYEHCSEFGSIGIAKQNGGIYRTA